jgi:CDP-glycerol glycerophosphotransferase (TagB/SpsB family)
LIKVRKKKKIKVAFIVLNLGIWKYEEIYLLLEKDSRFEPVIVICPPRNLGEESAQTEMNRSYNFFKEKNYSVLASYNEEGGTYLDIKKLVAPDIVFFTNPYGYTLKKYQLKNFLDVLTCYVQYSFVVEEKEHFYNHTFHNLLWKAFYETDVHKKLAERLALNRGANVEITGHPGTDGFIYGERLNNSSWKNGNESRKRIIWAPHWSIVSRGHGRPASSNFIELSQFMFRLAEEYRDKIQVAFKPHPYLKKTLYDFDGWGKERTDHYYETWDKLDNGQLETGSYTDLFNGSDGMILDSISFIVEYLYCGKPSLFLKADPDVNKHFNEFGNMAFEHHYHGEKNEDIIQFIEKVIIDGEDSLKQRRDIFYRNVLTPPGGKSASQNIYESLCEELF